MVIRMRSNIRNMNSNVFILVCLAIFFMLGCKFEANYDETYSINGEQVSKDEYLRRTGRTEAELQQEKDEIKQQIVSDIKGMFGD